VSAISSTRSLPSDGLSTPHRHWALAGLWIGTVMAVMDGSIMNVALPTISRDLAVSSAASTGVVTAYQVAIVMILLPASALAERVGYHLLYRWGLGVFVLLSLGCALASSLEVLTVCRLVQGLGAAAMMSVGGAQTRMIWPKTLFGRGIGYNAVVVSCAAAAGPPLAGLLLSRASWPWLFLVNVPTGLISLGLMMRFGPKAPPVTRSFDAPSAVLNAVMFCMLFLSASEVIQGHASPWLVAYLVTGLSAGALLLARMRAAPRPMIPLDLIGIRGMRPAYGASVCAFASQTCMLVYLPFVLQYQLRLDVATVGVLLLPLTIMIALSSPIAGHMSDKSWAGLMSALGLGLNAVAIAALALLIPGRPPLVLIAFELALCGLGFGLFQSPNNHVMLRRGPIERAGAAGGMQATCRLVGQTAGALIAALTLRLPQLGPLSGLYFAAGLAVVAAAFARSRSSHDTR
jgi:DHA2 family multidrug resistance protein-like MFS transporter